MKLCSVFAVVGLCLATWLVGSAVAQEKKEVVLKGKITCAKCELELTKKCASVIVVQEGGKDVVYYFDAGANKKYHAEICSDSRPGEVTGVISVVDGKKIITVSKLKFQ
jgi:Family of unknown function (DUF6370)